VMREDGTRAGDGHGEHATSKHTLGRSCRRGEMTLIECLSPGGFQSSADVYRMWFMGTCQTSGVKEPVRTAVVEWESRACESAAVIDLIINIEYRTGYPEKWRSGSCRLASTLLNFQPGAGSG